MNTKNVTVNSWRIWIMIKLKRMLHMYYRSIQNKDKNLHKVNDNCHFTSACNLRYEIARRIAIVVHHK